MGTSGTDPWPALLAGLRIEQRGLQPYPRITWPPRLQDDLYAQLQPQNGSRSTGTDRRLGERSP